MYVCYMYMYARYTGHVEEREELEEKVEECERNLKKLKRKGVTAYIPLHVHATKTPPCLIRLSCFNCLYMLPVSRFLS